jgi:hypothetical protein
MPGPPPLEPFGLVLHHDGRWSHEGQPIRHQRLREHFDHNVRYLPEEAKYVVTLRHFRAEIELEEAGFFVREVDFETATVQLSDRSEDRLDPASLSLSPIDGAMLCRVKHDLAPAGLVARFTHAAHAELADALDDDEGHWCLTLAGKRVPLPLLDDA